MPLIMPELKSYAQWGEDRLVWEYFERTPRGYFAEIGANDPEVGSQTFLLEENGWRGVLVEPQPALYERLRLRRPNSLIFQAACGSPAQRGKALLNIATVDSRSSLKKDNHDSAVTFSSTVEVEVLTLNEILEASHCPGLDFLSIDVEGAELDVLKGLDLQRHHPRLIIVEDYVFTYAVHRHLRAAGYKLVKRTGSNNWYVPKVAHFPFTSFAERLKLFRKMYLGTPARQMKLRLRGKKS